MRARTTAIAAVLLLALVGLALGVGGGVAPAPAAGLFLAVAAAGGLASLLPGLPGVPRDAALLAAGGTGLGLASLAWSHAPDATLDASAATAAAALVFLLAASLRARSARRLFATGLAGLGVLAAALALASFGEGERARAPFGNPNHLASWLLLPAAIAWVALGSSDPRRRGGRESAFLWFAVLGVVGAGLAATESRGGGLAAAAAGLGIAAIRRLGPGRGPVVAVAAGGAAALALAVVPLLWPEGLPVQRGADESSAGLRWSVYAATARVALDAAPLGVGLGAFGSVFDAYRPAGMPYSPHFAHSEPLQGLAELGVLFVLAAAAALALGVRRMRGVLRGGSRVGGGALAALLAVAAHGLVDFPLHVPAIALTAAALAGLLFAPPDPAAPSLSPAATRGMLAAGALGLALLAGTGWAAVQAEGEASGALAAGDFAAAEDAAARGLGARPARPALWTLRAEAAEHAARFAGGGPEALARAVEARRRAVAAAPGDALLHRHAARTLLRAGRLDEAAALLEEAARLDPRSPVGALARSRLALVAGDRLAAVAALRGALDRHPRAEGAVLRAALHDTGDASLVRQMPVDAATRAAVLAQSGFPREAASLLEAALDEGAAAPERALSAARLYRRVGDEAAARRVLERAARRSPEDGRLRSALPAVSAPGGAAR